MTDTTRPTITPTDDPSPKVVAAESEVINAARDWVLQYRTQGDPWDPANFAADARLRDAVDELSAALAAREG